MIKKLLFLMLVSLAVHSPVKAQAYQPTAENLAARAAFSDSRLGIFIHWGIYSLFAQGEWYLNKDILQSEYAKAADAFYPHRFDARDWVRAFKDAGAGYICFTSRHHDGFSMFKTDHDHYNIVEATPYGKDVMQELSQACKEQGMDFHVYYSILDWKRPDYPLGRTGLKTGRQSKPNYDSYFDFMKHQMHEILTRYAPVKAIWLDGYWDHDSDSIPFDWRMPEFYRYIHQLQPSCLIGNNHHIAPIEGEDFQMFERDLPGENKAGLSGQLISKLPLEMCQTMNGMWGYKVADTEYKSVKELIQLIIQAAAKGSNLLINIGPQPDGRLPQAALDRLKGIGEWMRQYGTTIKGTQAGHYGGTQWGVSTSKGKTDFLHILQDGKHLVTLQTETKPIRIEDFITGKSIKYDYDKKKKSITLKVEKTSQTPDKVITILHK